MDEEDEHTADNTNVRGCVGDMHVRLILSSFVYLASDGGKACLAREFEEGQYWVLLRRHQHEEAPD
jgi:hypothetical protein